MSLDGHGFLIRRVVIEYGAIPTSSCLAHLDSTAAISERLAQLRRHGLKEDGHCKSILHSFLVDYTKTFSSPLPFWFLK